MSEMKDRLKELRKALGLKQREIAEKLGVRVSAVGDWEVGRYPIPRARIYQLCHEYNVRREWLERGEGEMFQPEATFEEKLANAASALFDELSDRGKAAVLKAMSNKLGIKPQPPKKVENFPDDYYRLVASLQNATDDDELTC
ncbi:MAG: helix-turn-helix transcriptional regulator [Thermoguttaceae bacterium]|nr:helix-turn-helix transcriptional regulator [Thermoguttaceae bacterium]